MTRRARTDAARLAVTAAATLDTHVTPAVVLSLAMMFETWILDGGDATQAKFKLLPEDEATILTLVKP
jgi:hypothetical protein